MKYNCVYIGNRSETIDDQKSSFYYFYDVNEKILYKTEDNRMDQNYSDRKRRTFVEWIKDNLKWIIAVVALIIALRFIKNNLYGWLLILLFDIGASIYLRYSAIYRRVAEISEIKQNAQIVEMDADELKQFYKDSTDAQGIKLISLLISWAGPIFLAVLFFGKINFDWIAAWPYLSARKYRYYVDALPVNLYRLHVILNKKEDTAVTSLLIGSGLLIFAILYLCISSLDVSTIKEYPIIAVFFLTSVLIAPLSIVGLVVAIQEKKAGKRKAVLSILLNLLDLIIGMYFLLMTFAALIVFVAERKGIGV